MSLTQEDLELRRTAITGTDVADLVEGRAINVYLRKRGLEHVDPTEAMHWGTRLESTIADEYADRHDVVLTTTPSLVHHARQWQVGTPDRLVFDDAFSGTRRGLEIKCRSGFSAAEWQAPDGSKLVPLRVEAQCRWYMSLCDLGEWDVAVLINGNRYACPSEHPALRLTRDLETEANLLSIAEDFYRQHMLQDRQPDPDGSETWAKHLRGMFGALRKMLVPASENDLELAHELAVLSVNHARNGVRIEQIKQTLALRISDAAGLDLGNGDVIRRVYVKAHTRRPTPPKDVAAHSYLKLPAAWGAGAEE